MSVGSTGTIATDESTSIVLQGFLAWTSGHIRIDSRGWSLVTEADLTGQIVAMMEIFYLAGATTFTVISAYIVALYYFLNQSPVLMRVGAFSFFTLALAFLGISTYGAVRHYTGVLKALDELAAREPLSALGNMALESTASAVANWSVAAAGAVFVGLWLSLTYLTFVHRWPTGGPTAQSLSD